MTARRAPRRQMSESLPVCLMLALSGGGMDAYSYLCRGGVFANAQTGNILLFGVKLAGADLGGALRYLWPVLAFTSGIILSDLIRYRIRPKKLHWRQLAVVLEVVILAAVCQIPQTLNWLANVLTSLACGLQVESFRSVRGNAIATTMCIGNLRSGTYHLDRFLQNRDRKQLRTAALYYGVILFFVIGAVGEGWLIERWQEKAILFSVALLLAVCVLMLGHLDDAAAEETGFSGD